MATLTDRQRVDVVKAMAACGGVRSVVGTVVSPSAFTGLEDDMDVDEVLSPNVDEVARPMSLGPAAVRC
jgi:hypothetical protein